MIGITGYEMSRAFDNTDVQGQVYTKRTDND